MINSLDMNKIRYSTGEVVYNSNNQRLAIVLNGGCGPDDDPWSLVMEQSNSGFMVHTPPNRALIPIGKHVNLQILFDSIGIDTQRSSCNHDLQAIAYCDKIDSYAKVSTSAVTGSIGTETAKQGTWEQDDYDRVDHIPRYTCSCCNAVRYIQANDAKNFCPNCGADMRV